MAREQTPQPGDIIKRHRVATRLWHWTNALALLFMLMSGLMIFNAHPMLYWGEFGANADPAWLAIGDRGENGYLRVGSNEIDTTGILGRWVDARGEIQTRAFPSWVTLPSGYSLADARLWHLAIAWVLALSLAAYMVWSMFSRHIQRDLRITAAEITPAHLWHEVKNHARLRFPTGAAALRYNILQKLSYVGVIFLLLPAVILTGLTMSPGMDAAWHWLLSVFGGRQSARSLHFIAAMLLVAFVVVHLLMVVLAGPINEIRSMITGRYRLPGRRNNAT